MGPMALTHAPDTKPWILLRETLNPGAVLKTTRVVLETEAKPKR